MPDLKVAVVGCGRMGRERARCAHSLGAQIVSVFDVDQARAAELASSYGTSVADSASSCIASGVDALFVCTAPGNRGPVEKECVERALPFFVEKPIGTSLAQSSETLSLLERKPVIHGVGYMNRHRRAVGLARDILHSSEIIGLSAHWVCKKYNVPWWQDPRSSGGPHNEQATHLFDLIRFLCGEVSQVKTIFNGSTQAATLLRFETGALGTLFYSCDGIGKDIGLQIFTSSGSLFLSGWDFHLRENSVDGRVADGAGEDIFLIETCAFFQAVRSGKQELLFSSFPDAARTQMVLDAARESSQSLHPVEIETAGRSVFSEA